MADENAQLKREIQERRKRRGKPPLSPAELLKEVRRELARQGSPRDRGTDSAPPPGGALPPPGPIRETAEQRSRREARRDAREAAGVAPKVGQRGGGETAAQRSRRIAARNAREAAGIAPEVGQRGGGETPEQRARRESRREARPPAPRPSPGGSAPAAAGAPPPAAPPPSVASPEPLIETAAPPPPEVVPPPAVEPPPAEAAPPPEDAWAIDEEMWNQLTEQLAELRRMTPDWTQGGPPPQHPGWSYNYGNRGGAAPGATLTPRPLPIDQAGGGSLGPMPGTGPPQDALAGNRPPPGPNLQQPMYSEGDVPGRGQPWGGYGPGGPVAGGGMGSNPTFDVDMTGPLPPPGPVPKQPMLLPQQPRPQGPQYTTRRPPPRYLGR